MSRFEKFYDKELVVEKLTRKDAQEALKNPNLTIGAEFEFLLDDYEGVADTQAYEDAMTEYNRFVRDVEYARDQLENVRQEIYDEGKEIEELEGELEDLETKRDDFEEQIDTETTNVEEAESDVDDKLDAEQEASEISGESGGEDAETREKLMIAHSDADEEYQDAVSHLEAMKRQLEDVERWFREADAEYKSMEYDIQNRKSELEVRDENYLDEIEWPTEPDSDYTDYMDQAGYYDEVGDIYSMVAENDDLPQEPYDPSDGDYGQESSAAGIEEHMNNNGMLNDAPFDNYEFGDYSSITQKPGSDLWAIEDDPSVEGGCETKSPPMPLPEFMKIFPDMLAWIRKYGSTDSSTGMHVHMGVVGVKDLSKEINRLKMILFMDEGFIWKAFPDRENNTYVQSAKDKLKKGGTITDKDVKNIFDMKKLALKLSTEHYDAINFQNVSSGHIEFRYLGGDNYENKEKELTDQLGRFAYNMSLGLDPEFKKKEYQHKLQRIFNKMELFGLQWKTNRIPNLLQALSTDLSQKSSTKIGKLVKEWDRKIKRLKSVYKLDQKTKNLLRSNTGFTTGLRSEMIGEDLAFLTPDERLIVIRNMPKK